MNFRTLLATSVALVMTAGVAAAQDKTGWPESFTVGTASQGGTYFVYGSGFAGIISDELGIPGGGEVTGGPMQNMALVHTGEAAFGMTTMGPAKQSLDGTNPIAPGLKMDKACAMFPMYQTPFNVTALKSSGIETLSDIPEDAKIGFGPAGSTSDTYFPAMLENLGVKFERRNGSWNDLGSQLQDGLLDAVAFAAGVPTAAVSQLEAQTDVNFVAFSEDEQQKIRTAFPVASFVVPKGTYATQPGDLLSVSMWNFGIANCDLPESFVYEATKAIMGDHDRMMQVHKAAKTTVPENWDKNNVLKWHPGAAKWFNENGASIGNDMVYGG
ncbi:TAXI family TRAP transporter solute-binding subunit [Hoeflea prorocentri]|uniref:TAXI family TRAP transporter solute-binding subunit n=1 Tax=Hoeflea prorocentri TaxID=1922333 RepID=A0A9X3ZIT8_9HYPH|nr:TAXI family TRAP transporter solute-binding subunit [Hoeflea prorocentri]MCY6382080.1 TAXI family TRAP transporter solute-binding subunit [Hoeflea prorocentri]MDA5399880.1 TAXI family TRAP transporter solute-binding subunit [Hoeflea prorocentri]